MFKKRKRKKMSWFCFKTKMYRLENKIFSPIVFRVIISFIGFLIVGLIVAIATKSSPYTILFKTVLKYTLLTIYGFVFFVYLFPFVNPPKIRFSPYKHQSLFKKIMKKINRQTI